MPIKQSFCFPCFINGVKDLDTLFGQAKEFGFAGVEWWWREENFEAVVATAKQHGLVVASFCGHQSLGEGLNNRTQHARIVAELKENIALAAKHGIPNLICFSGNRNPGQSDADAIETCAVGLRQVIGEAEKAGISLNMELLNSKRNHPGYQADHTAWGVQVCEKVGSPKMRLLYDIYHMQIMEGDVIETITQNIQWIGHFHTAGNPGRHQIDGRQELNYPAICRAIAQTTYSGFVAHEFWPEEEALGALKAAFKICNV